MMSKKISGIEQLVDDATAELRRRSDRISALEATERELREALKVLAVEVVAIEKLLAAGTPIMKPVGYFLAASVLSNPIAAAAVREAGR